MTPVQPSVVAVQRHVMLSAVPSSGIVSSMIRITGIGDRDRPEWLIRISGIRTLTRRQRDRPRVEVNRSYNLVGGRINSI